MARFLSADRLWDPEALICPLCSMSSTSCKKRKKNKGDVVEDFALSIM